MMAYNRRKSKGRYKNIYRIKEKRLREMEEEKNKYPNEYQDYTNTVYVVRNRGFIHTDYFKIGRTDRPMEKRIITLNNSSLPYDFDIIMTFESRERDDLETILHNHFHNKRVREDKEFFKLNDEDLLQLRKIALRHGYAEVIELDTKTEIPENQDYQSCYPEIIEWATGKLYDAKMQDEHKEYLDNIAFRGLTEREAEKEGWLPYSGESDKYYPHIDNMEYAEEELELPEGIINNILQDKIYSNIYADKEGYIVVEDI